MRKRAYIIIVNWNGWADTLECLESLFRLSNPAYRVIVCDNGSSDGSLDHFATRAEGGRRAPLSDLSMFLYSTPPVSKPVGYRRVRQARGDARYPEVDVPLILIDCESNLGFAGACNVGLKFAMNQKDMAWAWLLNNDTVVDVDALSMLLEKIEKRPDAGVVGCTIAYYHHPHRVQAFGGARYFRCLGLSMHIGRFRGALQVVDEEYIERQLSYVMGASLFVTRSFIDAVGLMSEDYFLYYEELDWILRASDRFSQV